MVRKKKTQITENKPTSKKREKKLHIHDYSDLEEKVLTYMGDEHIGSKYYDETKHRKDVDCCLENKTPVILLGDMLECSTRDSVGAGIFEQDDIVQEQLEKAVRIYKPLSEAGLILGAHMGNHCHRVFKHSGTNLTKIICDLLQTEYLGYGATHYIKVGDQKYIVYSTHGDGGARTTAGKLNSVLKLNKVVDADLYVCGHLHDLKHLEEQYYKVNKRNKTIEKKSKHYVISGSYLDHGGYAVQKNFPPVKKGNVKVNFSGLEDLIIIHLGD